MIRQRTRRGMRLRAFLLAGVVFGATQAAIAGPVEDIRARAAAIQQLLDEKKPADGEALARAALREAEATIGAETPDTANIYRLLGDTLFDQKRFADAEPMFRKALALREATLGTDHPDTAVSAGDLGVTLKSLGRADEAVAYYQQALAIREKAFGPDHAETARSWFRLARLYDDKGDHAKAAETMVRAIAAGETAFGAGDRTIILWEGERAAMLHDAGDVIAAEPAYRAAIKAAEATFPADDIDLATFRQSLANLLRATERAKEAIPLYRLVLPVREATFGPAHPAVAATLDGLARSLDIAEFYAEALPVYQRLLSIREPADASAAADVLARIGTVEMRLDRIEDAEATFRRELALREAAEGAESPGVANAARWVARTAQRLDRDAEAEIFFRRALAISEKTTGPDSLLAGFDMLGLGLLYSGQQRFTEAEPLLTRASDILGGGRLETAIAARGALAFLKAATGKSHEAVALQERSLADIAAAGRADTLFGADVKLTLAQMLVDVDQAARAEVLAAESTAIYRANLPDSRAAIRAETLLGGIRLAGGQAKDAEAIFADVLDRLEARHGPDSTELQLAEADLARAKFALDDFAAAAALLESSVARLERLAAIDSAMAFSARTGEIEDVAVARASVFDHLVKTYHRLAAADPASSGARAEKAFLAAQRVIESQAAKALGQMASRQASGSDDLAILVRERQDLVTAWRTADAKLNEARSAAKRDPAAEASLATRLDDADRKIRQIDATLATEFPAFADLQKPGSFSFAATQEALTDDEVLLFFADTVRLGEAGFETYLWAVPKNGEPRWVRLPGSTGELSAAVRDLRNLMGVGGETRGAARIGGPEGDRTDRVLTAAHTLYTATLAPVADMIEGKSLVIVPSKRLASLPFHLLVSEPSNPGAADRYRDARWVARDHAITVLPSVASLGAAAVPTAAGTDRVPYLGFANPLLTGRSGEDRRAFKRQGCAPGEPGAVMVAAATPSLDGLFRGAIADVDAVRGLEPLPETTDEACAIAAALGAGQDWLRLGAAATEDAVKAMSDDASMSKARILHFATHGLVSGDLSGLAEPAIVLTPPDVASPRDDGLLTASEVAQLRIDADWVILSACNTASGDGGGEALSGLARAFFYSGARALMVSHWPVNSDAAVRLATGAIDAIASDPAMNRAEALRRAMVAEISLGGRHADPANWAPFILVGASR